LLENQCPGAAENQWRNGSAVAKTLSKTGITNLTKLNQMKMMKKYGSKGHIIETNNIVLS